MPVRKVIEDWTPDPADEAAVALKKQLLDEAISDEGLVQAKVNDLTTKHTTALTQLEQQKLKNYDLLQQIPAQHSSQTSGDKSDEPKEASWDDLFGTENKE